MSKKNFACYELVAFYLGTNKMVRSIMARILAVVVFLSSIPLNCIAEDPFRDVVIKSASKIKAVMDSVGAESVSLHNFIDKTTFGATVLPGIKQMLEAELRARNAIIKSDGGSVGISAELLIARNLDLSSADAKQLRIEFSIADRFGQEIDSDDGVFTFSQSTPDGLESGQFKLEKSKFADNFASPSAMLIGYGANADLDRYVPEDINSSLKPFLDSMDAPTGVIFENTTAKASSTSPFGLVVVSNGESKTLRSVDDKPYVDFEVGEEFSVYITNESKERVMATLSLDGLNSFFKSEEKLIHGDSWVIGANETAEIPGFYLNSHTAKRFTATTFQSSARAKAGLGETPIGAITVAIYDAIEVQALDVPSEDEAQPSNDVTYTVTVPVRIDESTNDVIDLSDPSTPDIYIADGQEVSASVGPPVTVEQGKLRAVISIRYRHPKS